MRFLGGFVLAGAIGFSGVVTGCGPADEGSTFAAVTRGAAFTTFDEALGGCGPGSPNGINCNHYVCEDRVYINGGPNRRNGGNVLGDGTYYFTVIAPGSQNGGAAQGAEGNLSDDVAHGGADLGSGDSIANRTFTMSRGVLSYTGTHALGTSPNGQRIVGLAPFDVTPNPGGVYIVAVCRVGSSAPADCKYDAFKTERCDNPPPPKPCQHECPVWDDCCVICPPDPPACDPSCSPEGYASCVPCL